MQRKSLYRNIVLFFIASLVAFATITSLLSKVIENHLNNSINAYITENFSDDIRYYLLRGNRAEVYKKCKKLSQNEIIDFLLVKDSFGDILCSFGSSSNSRLENRKKLYYDIQKEGLLSTVHIEFKSNFHNLVIIISSLSVFIFFLIALVLGVHYLRKGFNLIASPFEKLVNRIDVLGIDIEGITYFNQLKDYKELNHIYTLIARLVKTTLRQQEKVIKDNKSSTIYEVSRQILHDIRSPLTTLKVLAQEEEIDKEMFSLVISRVEQIANDLSSNISASNMCFIHFTVQKIIQEKRIEYQGKNLAIEYNCLKSNIFKTVNLSEIELSRILSNLINNSFEAFKETPCKILIQFHPFDSDVILTLEDNGPGIPNEKHEEVLLSGVSYKTQGTGLGLHYCNITLQKRQGSISLSQSSLGGLKTEMKMKRSKIPDEVFATTIKATDTLIIIDDEPETFQRLQENPEFKIKYYNSPQEARTVLENLKNDLVLVDYNFANSDENGLSLIQDIPSNNKFLFTNDFDNVMITNLALKAGIKIIPKPYLEHVNSLFHLKEMALK